MESLMGIIQSPVFIGSVLFLGIVALARVLLVKDSSLKRSHGGDRRQPGVMPAVPFYDSGGILVTQERRTCPDRRRSRLLEMENNLNRSRPANF